MESGREQYFRLDTDPQEMRDTIGEPDRQERIEYLWQILIRELAGREEEYSDSTRLLSGRQQKSCLSFLPPADMVKSRSV